ncbi:Etoposide induced 2.4 mRNA [Phytophthora pseudosyringae]|uniref:Etoposide induced 2.4 mRNA n=1 Tax=Phytophthora pseudosyringae TaxID=221518 RepID=A0A8T1W3R4_9STRA|nr:Etoposide induced 2.4 mRNA [Phytophthora pseudosyringae]
MADAFSAGFREFCGGVQHAVSLHRILLFYLKSRLICVSSVKCFVLNGLIFLGSIYFFDQAVIPVIHLFGELLHRSFSYGTATQVDDVRDRVDGFVFLLYQVLWMYPIYCISFILNTIWYQEIADDAYMQLHGKPSPTSVTDMIRDEMYRAILVAFFLLQTVLSYLIPVIGPATSFIHLSWLYSLYCFEYKWSLAGWSLERRLAHLEQNWAYFAGFGSPFTLATFFVPNFVSKGIFALLFPVFLLLAIACDPVSEGDEAPRKLPIFRREEGTSCQQERRQARSSSKPMPEAYTVSKMLSSINEVMAPVATDVCGSVTLQRKTENGIMLNTSEKEIAYLDTKARVKHSAQQVAQLDKPAKAHWVATQRRAGNNAFHRGEYQQAAEAYIQALTALDFGSTAEEKITCQQELQVPLTCNLAACMLMMEQWEKARLMCDQVLAIDPNCIKALQQRAKAKTKLSHFDDARADVSRAKQVARGPSTSLDDDSDQLVDRLDKQLEDISRAELRHKHQLQQQKQFQKKMMQDAVGKLYKDKKEVNCTQDSGDTSDVQQHHKSFLTFADAAISCNGWNTGVAWVLAVFVMLANMVSRFLVAARGKLKTS